MNKQTGQDIFLEPQLSRARNQKQFLYYNVFYHNKGCLECSTCFTLDNAFHDQTSFFHPTPKIPSHPVPYKAASCPEVTLHILHRVLLLTDQNKGTICFHE